MATTDPVSRRRPAITAGLLLGITLAALEATVVGTAMPTVVATLGGLDHYSWVFSAYLLTSTASLPIWGRLSDQFGRRRIYLIGIAMFLAGSALSGAARSMLELVLFRAVQGLGAGALIPIALTILGELYTIEERARMQAVFSGAWGVASIGGPLVGGWLTDMLSWRWVFFINLPFGAASAAIIAASYPEASSRRETSIDWVGAVLLFAALSALLAALAGLGEQRLVWLTASVVLGVAFALVERSASDPILPFRLFANRMVLHSLLIVFLLGIDMFGAVAFIPLMVQGTMGGSATAAGTVLTPLFLGWVLTSIVAARLLLRVGYRTMTAVGIVLMVLAFLALAGLRPTSSRAYLGGAAFVLGGGMGFAMLALLLAIQHGVERSLLGVATSMNQFFRSVGAALGVSLMGAILSFQLGADGSALQLELGPTFRLDPASAARLASALRVVFESGVVVALLALVPTAFLPPVDFKAGVPAGAGEQLLAAEMTSLEPDDEPICIRE